MARAANGLCPHGRSGVTNSQGHGKKRAMLRELNVAGRFLSHDQTEQCSG